MAKVSFTEYYLRHPNKLVELHPDKQRAFWEQRKWHPIVRMRWMDSTQSNGEGMIVYPDGSRYFYDVLTNGNGK